ncbi:MAG: DDE-type integrase/transposase/recombinase [bacterium]|nr:DDE-type integrase/transposase/recombinase [bacterium]
MKSNYYGRMDLFRYSVIAPLINNTNEFNTINEYCDFVASKSYDFEGKVIRLTSKTVKNWYYKYRKEGLESLENHKRCDKNNFRKIKNELVEDRIIELRKLYPRITTKKIYEKLLEDNYITSDVSVYAIFRYLKNNNLKAVQISKKEKKKYEHDYPNDSWQSDTSTGPYIKVDGKSKRVYLIMIIDDASRLIVGYDFFFEDNAINMQKVLKSAIKKYGVPKQLYVDNGSPYKNEQISLITARLGIKLIHAKPYSPTGKGKIERSFRTIKDGWLYCSNWNEFKTIEDVKDSFSNYLYKEYINKEHSETKITPNNKWHNEIKELKQLEEEKIEEAFMHSRLSKVYNDSTIQINNEKYEVPYKYVGQKIEVRYYVSNPKEIIIYKDGKRCETCKLVDKKANSRVYRKNNIDYDKMINKESEEE